jgi:hypothetical protein
MSLNRQCIHEVFALYVGEHASADVLLVGNSSHILYTNVDVHLYERGYES